MNSADVVRLPVDRKGRTLHVDDVVELEGIVNTTYPAHRVRGTVYSMTLLGDSHLDWVVALLIGNGPIADKLSEFDPKELVRIKEASNA